MAPLGELWLEVEIQYCDFLKPCSSDHGVELGCLPWYHVFEHEAVDVIKGLLVPVVEPAYRQSFRLIIVKCH